MAELANLKSKRSLIKSKVTRLNTHFNSIDQDNLDDIIAELVLRLNKVTTSF